MRDFTKSRIIEWGECDAAGIVYYPHYYMWMDNHFHAFGRSLGVDQRMLKEAYGLLGTPLVDTGCRFRAPATYGDELQVTLVLAAIGTSSLNLHYRFARGDTVTAEGRETRVFVRSEGEGIVTAPIPEDVRAAFTPYLAPVEA
ncbi:acyl-CoA thioesterase [Acuticoccus mangrovi]|uniref:Acyl-CoA thioesterase n=1 Tax=Acuticoccus mangrovi TaxID=2796142 RepID=A0A934MI24_9HYPH|nr:thioesterase family protein [Acuticoccus mangrovi]MBJ3778303.1 acyl-CoA thioesterase [Acuticoccus mangrovi]